MLMQTKPNTNRCYDLPDQLVPAFASVAAALNAGQHIQWPKGANSIRVELVTGKRATVMRGDEDTLKGTGIDARANHFWAYAL